MNGWSWTSKGLLRLDSPRCPPPLGQAVKVGSGSETAVWRRARGVRGQSLSGARQE